MHPAFAAQPASNAEASEMSGAKASLELPSSDRTVSTTTEPPDAFQIGDRFGGPTQSTEARGSEPIPLEPLLVPDTSVIPETGPSVASVTTPAEVRDQIPREVEFQRGQHTKLDQDNLASDEKALAQQVKNQRVPHKPVTQNADLHNRVQKECGSIIYPALRRHCVASFGVPYRWPANEARRQARAVRKRLWGSLSDGIAGHVIAPSKASRLEMRSCV